MRSLSGSLILGTKKQSGTRSAKKRKRTATSVLQRKSLRGKDGVEMSADKINEVTAKYGTPEPKPLSLGDACQDLKDWYEKDNWHEPNEWVFDRVFQALARENRTAPLREAVLELAISSGMHHQAVVKNSCEMCKAIDALKAAEKEAK